MRRSRVFALALGVGLLIAGCSDGTAPIVPNAPSPVANLAVEHLGDAQATLSWTAPRVASDDGQAMRYRVFYSSSNPGAFDLNTATAVAAPPTPARPGVTEHFTVTGLARLSICYFAVQSDDGQGDWSLLSNTPAATIPWYPNSQADLIAKLEAAYSRHDYALFASLFPAPEDSLPYLFFTIDAGPPPYWDQAEELRIHRRMFDPQHPAAGEAPVNQDLWVDGISIHLTPQTVWTERPDLYRSPSNPGGVNALRWRVTDAIYRCYVLWMLQGPTWYQVNGRQNFVVAENVAKQVGDDRKFVLYRWEDLGSLGAGGIAVESSAWTHVKALYGR